ncbi:MAG TPA: trypsin-like peptidase domain-containing protein, partial [Gemmataceae bacterium]
MTTCIRLSATCLLLVAPVCTWAGGPADSVVKITATLRYPNPLKPWAKGEPKEVTGTGIVIEGKRILTNSHLVLYASDIAVQTRPGADKIEAKIAGLGADVDLAVLTLKDDALFKKQPSLTAGKGLPKVQDNVEVYGFPIGGDDLAVTKGVISRIGFGTYFDFRPGLMIQVSAPINPGSSGGPAVVNGKLAGVVFSRLVGAENTGYIIPYEEVEYFLDHLKDGRSEAKPMEATGVEFQRLENDAFRHMLKLDKDVKGVLVHPPPRHEGEYPLKEFDILTKVGDYPVDNLGMVRLENDVFAPLTAAVPKAARDRAVAVTILRGGKPLTVSLPVTTRDNRLIPDYQGEAPAYFIHGPLAFSPVRVDGLMWYTRLNPDLYSNNSPMLNRRLDRVQFPGEELVAVTAPM